MCYSEKAFGAKTYHWRVRNVPLHEVMLWKLSDVLWKLNCAFPNVFRRVEETIVHVVETPDAYVDETFLYMLWKLCGPLLRKLWDVLRKLCRD